MLKISLLSLTFLLLLSSSQAEVTVIEDAPMNEHPGSLDSLMPMLDFVKELLGVYTQIEDIRNFVPQSPTETIYIWDLLNQTNTKALCKTCLGFVSGIRKAADRPIIKKILTNAALSACRKKQTENVCAGAIGMFIDEVFEIALDRAIRPERLCQKVGVCPRVEERDYLKDYIKEVMKDKPERVTVKPTKKSTYSILQLADPHLDQQYETGTNAFCNEPICCRSKYGNAADPSKAAGYWGSLSQCDLPMRTFQEFLRHTSETFDIDMIIWTGDNIAHDIWEQTIDNQTQPTYELTKEIMKFFPNTKVYPTFGNHEAFPVNQFDHIGNTSAWLMEELAEMWEGWLDEDALKTFKKHSYYAMVDPKHNVKLIGLNTEACDTDDYYLIRDPEDPMGQLKWLREEFYDSERKNQGVFLFGHIPTGDYGCYSEWSSRYRALIDRFSNIVRGQFFGHTHTDKFQVARSIQDNQPIAVNFISPSFTTYSDLKPSFRIYEVDAETNVVVNYHQYRLDLNKWNKVTNGPIQWDLAYSFVEEYGVPDLSPQSFDIVAERILKDPEVAKIYQYHHESGTRSKKNLTPRETKHIYCGLKHSISKDIFHCLGLSTQVGDLMSYAKNFMPGKWYAEKC